jgi:hypothetical protein
MKPLGIENKLKIFHGMSPLPATEATATSSPEPSYVIRNQRGAIQQVASRTEGMVNLIS